MKSSVLTLLHVSERDAHGLQDCVFRRRFLEHCVQDLCGFFFSAHPAQGQSHEHLAALEVRLLLQHLLGLLQRLLVIAIVQ